MLIPNRTSQRRAPFNFRAKLQRRGNKQNAQYENAECQPPDMAGGQKGCREHNRKGRGHIKHVPADEIERVKPEPGRNRRARGKREHNAAEDEREQRGQQQPIDRPPPGRKVRALKP